MIQIRLHTKQLNNISKEQKVYSLRLTPGA